MDYSSTDPEMASLCEGAGSLKTERFIKTMVFNYVREEVKGQSSLVSSHPGSFKRMGFGQYADLTYREVYESFPGYTKWGFTQEAPSKALKAYLDFACELGAMPGLHNEEFSKRASRSYFRALTGPEFAHFEETWGHSCQVVVQHDEPSLGHAGSPVAHTSPASAS